jgi:hypothetical protein
MADPKEKPKSKYKTCPECKLKIRRAGHADGDDHKRRAK